VERDVTRSSHAYAIRGGLAGLLIAAAMLPGTSVAGAAAAVPMASHHAIYKLSLLKAKGANAPASAVGVIDYNFSGSACDGYTTTFRQLTELQPSEGDARVNDLRSTTFEEANGSQFSFKTTTRNDNDVVTDVDGRARKLPDGEASVELKTPPGRATLGDDILFPTEHLRRIIGVAEAGGKLLEAKVYDGSDTGKKVFRTLTVIGRPIDAPSQDPVGAADGLKTVRRWPVSISYFDKGKEDAPDYILSFDLYENGISRALKLDYGDFVLEGDLTDLTVKAPSPCK
jgi:hypothetical protein